MYWSYFQQADMPTLFHLAEFIRFLDLCVSLDKTTEIGPGWGSLKLVSKFHKTLRFSEGIDDREVDFLKDSMALEPSHGSSPPFYLEMLACPQEML